jgi:hypothetical protein
MSEAEMTALVERIVDEKLRERERKGYAAVRDGLLLGLRDAQANIAELRKLSRGA